ncbi:hypothetical protein MNBD_GAMMA23-355 [hydrothermal vent metagenome]|uniref:Uncharacterized protein n=1 Tax=hydrothermal vent metagenome TaxID=652676 RepID=A0A3B1AJE6_9ZZZZ
MTNTTTTNSTEAQYDEVLLHASVKLNTRLLAGVFGLISGLSLFVITYISLYRGMPDTGQYLRLLGVFLPGYEVSHFGAWVGFFWAFIIGALLAGMFYRIYARSIPDLIQDYLRDGAKNDDLLGMPMRLSGHYLGLALGAIIAGGLIVTTNWLVIRGTADESTHAQLLVNFLPGYSVSTIGSFIGAIELFIFSYILSLFFCWIYNNVVAFRGTK